MAKSDIVDARREREIQEIGSLASADPLTEGNAVRRGRWGLRIDSWMNQRRR